MNRTFISDITQQHCLNNNGAACETDGEDVCVEAANDGQAHNNNFHDTIYGGV